ncbi:glycosyltransferase family 8 protein [Roseivirga sp.]|uniref:glycosyltransferase family 8 protein n=1 Tax=Roseivirga sp. TaxID=1964215 RepID=UPI003B8BBA28
MNLFLTFDRNYTQHAVVMLRSLFDNHSGQRFDLFIYSEDQDEIERLLKKEFHGENFGLSFIDYKYESLPKLTNRYYNENYYKIIYTRLHIGELLPDLDRVLSIDVDIIVNGSIEEFYNTELNEDQLFAGVAEVRKSEFSKFGIHPEHRNSETNFNCGVLLIDLKKWREWGVSEKTTAHIIKNEKILGAPTQDTLNPLYYNNWKIASPKYNLHHFYLLFPFKIKDLPYSLEEVKVATKNPVIIHYTGSMNPWNYLDIHPYRKLYWKYLKRTSFRDYEPIDRNFKNMIIKYRRLLMVKTQKLINGFG